MKEIRKFKAGDVVPENAKHIYSQTEKEYSHTSYDWGLIWDTRYTHYKAVTYHYYEIDDKIKVTEEKDNEDGI